MRWVLALALALAGGAAEGRAAGVQIDVDLGEQVMRVAAASGETYEWPISSGGQGPRDAARRI